MVGHRYSIEKAEAFKLEGIIIENSLIAGVTLEPNDVRMIKQLNLRLCEGKKYALLVDPKVESLITDEARALLASKEMAELNIAKAILIYNQKQKIIGNIYLSINKPHVKTKLFTDREKALKWLRMQVEEFTAKQMFKERK
ncbi:hypothetical protein CNR22_21295 [Sphingobacteriaceae bacterium]|nr:hypothetical protein CNR22_21295 [Sphingobacteriaceae bacterium]